MKDKQMKVEVILPITSKNHRFYNIVNENDDTIATIFIRTSVKRNEFDESYSWVLDYSMIGNPLYEPTEQEMRSAEWLFSNLVKVVQYDISGVIDVDLLRINDILPINIKIEKIRKEQKVCLKEIN